MSGERRSSPWNEISIVVRRNIIAISRLRGPIYKGATLAASQDYFCHKSFFFLPSAAVGIGDALTLCLFPEPHFFCYARLPASDKRRPHQIKKMEKEQKGRLRPACAQNLITSAPEMMTTPAELIQSAELQCRALPSLLARAHRVAMHLWPVQRNTLSPLAGELPEATRQGS